MGSIITRGNELFNQSLSFPIFRPILELVPLCHDGFDIHIKNWKLCSNVNSNELSYILHFLGFRTSKRKYKTIIQLLRYLSVCQDHLCISHNLKLISIVWSTVSWNTEKNRLLNRRNQKNNASTPWLYIVITVFYLKFAA